MGVHLDAMSKQLNEVDTNVKLALRQLETINGRVSTVEDVQLAEQLARARREGAEAAVERSRKRDYSVMGLGVGFVALLTQVDVQALLGG